MFNDLDKDLKSLELYTFSFLMDKISNLQKEEHKLDGLPLNEKIKDENVNKFNSLLNEEMKYSDVIDGFFMTNNTKDGIRWIASLGKNEEEKNLRKEIIYSFVLKNKNVLTSIDTITKGLDNIKKEQEKSYEDMF